MKKSELIEKIKELNQHPKTEEAFHLLTESVIQKIAEGQRVEFRGLGSFNLKQHKAKKSRNPKTGEVVFITNKHSIHFKTSKNLEKQLNSGEDTSLNVSHETKNH
jgi:integration host factor subunit beta